MFTGLVKELGEIKKITPNAEGIILEVSSHELISEIGIDDSVAINGTCQTAVKVNTNSFEVQAIHTTLEKTTFKNFKVGTKVNLELALRASDRLGGHFVQGHVNGTTKLLKVENTGKNYVLSFSLPENLSRYFISEGSIAIDGISLTISRLEEDFFQVSIIPHTWENTNLSGLKISDEVNLEVDMLAKYLERLILKSAPESSKLTKEWIKSMGF